MELQLPEIPLLRLFSFLDAFSLLQVSQVNKYWNRVAQHDHLWRNLCLKKWNLSPSCYQCPRLSTWKQFFLHQTRLECRMAAAKPGDFVYKEGAGNLGILSHMAYLSESCQPAEEQGRSLLCTVSLRRMLHAWDVQEGTMLWSSPVQQTSIKLLAALPQRHFVFTVDMQETVKVWDCQREDALAGLTMPRKSLSVEALLAKDGPFLMVGNSEGCICTLRVPGLEMVSVVKVSDHSVELLRCSPNARWVLAAAMHQRALPQVFLAECLLRQRTLGALLSAPLPVSGCCTACWAPRRANRVTVMFRRAPFEKTGFTTFDVTTEQIGDKVVVQALQVASFTLPAHMESPTQMGASDGTVIVLNSGPQLLLFTISGLLLQCFQDHQLSICRLWVGPVYVLTTSMDNYVCLYMWEDRGHHSHLRSCCHLEHRRGDQTPSCYVSSAICDSASIACVVSKSRDSSVLVMYSLRTC